MSLKQSWLRQGSVLMTLSLCFVLLTSYCRGNAPYETKEILNIVYKTVGDQELKLNLFLPMENGEILTNRPTLIWVDSGCWYSNEPQRGGIWGGMMMVEKGFAVASVSHRSLEKTHFPDQIEDMRAAVRFLRANAKNYGLDAKRFAVSGGSSGGNMSLCLGIPDGVSPFDVGENLDQSSQVQAVVDFFGPSYFEGYLNDYHDYWPVCAYQILGTDPEKEIPNQLESLRDRAKLYSPINYVSDRFAPTLIFHGVMDRVVPISQSVLMYESLLSVGVLTHFKVNNFGVHDINSLGPFEETSAQIIEFLKEVGFEDEKTAL